MGIRGGVPQVEAAVAAQIEVGVRLPALKFPGGQGIPVELPAVHQIEKGVGVVPGHVNPGHAGLRNGPGRGVFVIGPVAE